MVDLHGDKSTWDKQVRHPYGCATQGIASLFMMLYKVMEACI